MNSKGVSSSSLGLLMLVLLIEMIRAQNETVSLKVGVIVDMDVSSDKKGLSSIRMALSDFYATHAHYTTRLVPYIRDSRNDVVGAASAALDLIKNVEVQAIIGPKTSMQADFIIDLGEKARVPIISFTATSPSLTSFRSPYFLRAAQNDATQVNAITAIIKTYGWREVVPIYVDDEYGQGILPYLIDALQEIDTRVPYRSSISLMASDDQIEKELYKLMAMQTRVFIVHMSPVLGEKFFAIVRDVGMMSKGYVWIMTDGLTNIFTSFSPKAIDSMRGVLGVKPYVPKTREFESFRARWKNVFLQENPDMEDSELTVFELWAYDAATALAMAVEKAGTANLSFEKGNTTGSPSTDLTTLGVSSNGPNLLRALSNIRFNGLSGDFFFLNGQLPSSAFEVVNVIGDKGRGVGFWRSGNRLVKKLTGPSKSGLAHVIWPGDTTSVPKGWKIPTNEENKLKIGVPVKEGYHEFIKTEKDNDTNSWIVTGFCIDVFDAVMDELPYPVDYEYIAFAKSDGSSAGTYDELVYKVHAGEYDAVVGDVTIIANRSNYVDFTLPYTESGVSMVVPITDKKSKNAWVFLKPLTWDLWVTSFCFFVFIGFCVWVLEHRINEDFRGPPSHQVGTAFWFSFSTMVFSHKERVVSNLARLVVIIWCFVVLILTQSYTASLTSLLTVQQLIPTVTDVNQLLKNGDNVGYLKDSFVAGTLKNLGFDEDRLKIYKSREECDELFRKGSKNGGIAAAFDEIPYIKSFLAKYCTKYTMVEPSFKTAGFGFVFPKGSPLVADISRAILSVTEGDKMNKIEDSNFGKQITCRDVGATISSNSLSLESFWGLFIIAGGASAVALITFAAKFAYENRQVLRSSGSDSSAWSKIVDLFRVFDQRDLKSHTFKKSEIHVPPSMGAQSPSVYSVRTDFPEEQGGYCGDSPTSGQVTINIELAEANQESRITNNNY